MAIAIATMFHDSDIYHAQTHLPQGTVEYASVFEDCPKMFEPKGIADIVTPVVPMLTINQLTNREILYCSRTTYAFYYMRCNMWRHNPKTLITMMGV